MITQTVIVGAGPVGLLTAIYLAQRVDSEGNKVYHNIKVLEKRPKPKEKNTKLTDYNYNLTISYRGLNALDKISGLKEEVTNDGIFFNHIINCIRHDNLSKGYKAVIDGERLSIKRSQIVLTLIKYIENHHNQQIGILFDSKVEDIDLEFKTITLAGKKKKGTDEANNKLEYDILIGSDGVNSIVGQNLRESCKQIDYHKEVEIEPYIIVNVPHSEFEKYNIKFDKDTMYTIQSNSNNGNIVILPNKDSFGFALTPTCQLNQASHGNKYHCTHTIKDSYDLYNFLIFNFPSLGEMIYDNLALKLGIKNISNSKLESSAQSIEGFKYTYETVYYSQFHHDSEPVIIIGDAAHSMVPTVGQGINCGFEDVVELNEILNQVKDDWTKVPKLFTQQRKKEVLAIQKISKNYIDERTTKSFQIRMMFDLIRNILFKLLPKGLIQPNVMHLLSQTNTPYSNVLSARVWHYRCAWFTTLLSTLSLVYFLTRKKK